MSDKLRFGCLLSLLALANGGIRSMSHGKPIPLREGFELFPTTIAGWTGRDLPDMSERERRVLKADDSVSRVYQRDGLQFGLFIAYYRQQRSGDALHSPKNCLPGSGWEPVESVFVQVPGSAPGDAPFEANHYVVEKDGAQEEVLYWYQAGERRFASEYMGKIFLVWYGITKNRTDGALIRITGGPTSKNDRKLPEMIAFAKELSAQLPRFLPD